MPILKKKRNNRAMASGSSLLQLKTQKKLYRKRNMCHVQPATATLIKCVFY